MNIKFYYWHLSDLGRRSRSNPDLWYSCSFIYSFSWLKIQNLSSQATEVSKENNNFHFFPIQNHRWPNLTFDVDWVKVKPVIIWINYEGPRDPNTTYTVSSQSVHWFRRSFFLMFLPYTGMAATFEMWPNSYYLIFISLFLKAFLWNLVANNSVVSEKNTF